MHFNFSTKVLKDKKITAPPCQNRISPFPNTAFASGEAVENIWLAFRQAKEKIGWYADKSQKSCFVEWFYPFARTYFSTKLLEPKESWKPTDNFKKK